MRKIRLVLVTLCLLLLPITLTKAQVTTKVRTANNNYGVKKNWDMNEEKYNYAKQTPYVDASEKIYDFSDILTDEEEKALYDRIIPMIEKYKMEIIILTYDYPYTNDMDNEYFVSDFYDFNDFGLDFTGYSGVVLFRNTYEKDPYYDMLSFGAAENKFTSSRMSVILDDIFNDIRNKRYLDGFNRWLDDVNEIKDDVFGIKYGNSTTKKSTKGKNVDGAVAVGVIVFIVSMIIFIIVYAYYVIIYWKVFKKAGRNGWEAIIPFYNYWVLFEISGYPGAYSLFILIPCAGPIIFLVFSIMAAISLAKKFKKGDGFHVLLWLIPIVGYSILAFDSSTYDDKLGEHKNKN